MLEEQLEQLEGARIGILENGKLNAEEMLNALEAWCVSAEASGIQALREFVDDLKTYSSAGARA